MNSVRSPKDFELFAVTPNCPQLGKVMLDLNSTDKESDLFPTDFFQRQVLRSLLSFVIDNKRFITPEDRFIIDGSLMMIAAYDSDPSYNEIIDIPLSLVLDDFTSPDHVPNADQESYIARRLTAASFNLCRYLLLSLGEIDYKELCAHYKDGFLGNASEDVTEAWIASYVAKIRKAPPIDLDDVLEKQNEDIDRNLTTIVRNGCLGISIILFAHVAFLVWAFWARGFHLSTFFGVALVLVGFNSIQQSIAPRQDIVLQMLRDGMDPGSVLSKLRIIGAVLFLGGVYALY